MLKETEQLTEICILSHVIAQSVFQTHKDVSIKSCKQYHVMSDLNKKIIIINQLFYKKKEL